MIRRNRSRAWARLTRRLPKSPAQPPHVVITTHHNGAHCPGVTNDESITRSPSGATDADHTDIPQYEIRVKGHLGSRWTAWFDGLSITNEDGGTTVISGPVVDQAALHGLLHKLRDAGISLVSLTELPPGAPHSPIVAPIAPHTRKGN